MKTGILLQVFIVLLSISLFAQPANGRHKDQIKSMKVAFITTELSLTPEEATKFWPIYNVFEEKQFDLKHKKAKAFVGRMEADLDKMTEKEAASLLTQLESNEEELYQIRKKFIASLKGILPSVKIIKLKKAEDNFNKKLLQQYRDKGPRK